MKTQTKPVIELSPETPNLEMTVLPMKNLTIVYAEGGHADLTIQPGTTVRDVKNQLGLGEDYILSRPGSSAAVAEDEGLYAWPDGSKLTACRAVTVGTDGFFHAMSSLGSLFDTFFTGASTPITRGRATTTRSVPHKRQPVLARSFPSAPVVTNGRRLNVGPDTRSLWEQRGWTYRDNGSSQLYEGYYRTPSKSCRGKVTVSPSGCIELFVLDPPDRLKSHLCFHARPHGWYFIHTHDLNDVSSGIAEVERLISGACTL